MRACTSSTISGPSPAPGAKGQDILCASYEGVSLLSRMGEKWHRPTWVRAIQQTPKGSRGASEIKQGQLKGGKKFIATIEPWHGHQVVVYTEPATQGTMWDRHVVDEELRWGHGVWTADLDGDGSDELIIGVRDDLDPKDHRRGVRIYKALDERGAQVGKAHSRQGGVAVKTSLPATSTATAASTSSPWAADAQHSHLLERGAEALSRVALATRELPALTRPGLALRVCSG